MRRRQQGAFRCCLAFLVVACSVCCWTNGVLLLPQAAAEIVDSATTTTSETKDIDDSDTKTKEDIEFDEDEIVRETIAAGRGDRDEQGIRDQWLSDEHLQQQFDSRKPISAEVERLLRAYQLTCEGCDHDKAVKKVNRYVRETKRRMKEEKEAQARRDSWARRIFGALVVIGASTAYVYQKELGLEFLFQNGGNSSSNNRAEGMSADRAELLRRRQQAADAASRRKQQEQKEQQRQQPSWLDNERKEVWTAKQEKQFQKALKEFAGVRKNERYKLIAEKVNGKSRIECLTHHRMQEFLARHPTE